MRSLIKFILTLFVGFFLFYFIVKETGVDAIWEGLSLFFGIEGLSILAVTFLIVVVGAYRWKIILHSKGEDISFVLLLRYLIKGFTVDFLTPFSLFGGEAVRIFLMENKIGIKKSASSAITDKILDVTAHFCFLLFGFGIFIFVGSSFPSIFLLYATCVILLLFFVLTIFYVRVYKKKSFLDLFLGIFKLSKKRKEGGKNVGIIFETEKEIIDFFLYKKEHLIKSFFLSILRHLFFLLRIFLIIFFITGSTDLYIAVAIYGLTILSMFLPIPAAIGGLEAILAMGFSSLGVGIAAGVSLAMVLRSADLIICFFGIILFIRLSFKAFYRQFFVFLESFR